MALKGVRVLELAGLAPAPFCGMVLSDFGADVVRVDRIGGALNYDVTARGKKSIAVDLKKPEGTKIIRNLSNNFDVILEPFRAGVMEKLGLGPEVLTKSNPRLIYVRLTGYGETGPFSHFAGHDINYLAMSGVLSKLGRKDENPIAPVNLLADFAGGGLTCAMGIMAALFERSKSGKGQVIDSSMVEGAAYVSSWIYNSRDMFVWGKPRGQNFLDTGAHFYETYKTSDGKFLAVGAIEPQFYDVLLQGLEMTSDELPQFGDPDELKVKLASKIASKTRDEWAKIFDALPDACVIPVLELDEAPYHPQNLARKSFVKNAKGNFEPCPAPRLSRTPAMARTQEGAPEVGQHSIEVLKTELALSDSELDNLIKNKVVLQSSLQSNL